MRTEVERGRSLPADAVKLEQTGQRTPSGRADCWTGRDAGIVAAVAMLLLTTLAFGSMGCAKRTKPRKSCLVFYASDNLNLYAAEPHPVTVYTYPLSSSAGFDQTSVEDLLDGQQPAGVLAPPVPITVSPGEKRRFQEMFPADTAQLGVLADYYRAAGDPAGTRTQVVPARCGMRKPKLVLSPKDIYRK